MTFTSPHVDTSATYGSTSVVGPESFGSPFLDSGAGFAGLFLTADGLDLFIDGAPFTSYRDLDFRDPRDAAGSFSFDVPRDLFTGIAFDDIVEVQLDGQSVFAGVVEGITHSVYNESERPAVTVTGRSLDALFDQAVVYPSRGVGVLPIEDVRSFSWVAPDYDYSAWPNAKRINRQREYANYFGPTPWIWPDTAAWWIWANQASSTSANAPVGTCLFRNTFTLSFESMVKVFVAGDNIVDLYVDGAEMSSSKEFVVGRYITLRLSAGTHYVAAAVENVPWPYNNPGGFLFAAYTVGETGLLDDLILDSDTDWSCLPYPDVMPGFTHGQVIRQLVEEAQADDALNGITLDFTDTVDSSGQDWGEYREITVQVGRTVLEVLTEMAGTYIEFEVTANKVLRAWNRDNRGTVRSATLAQTTSTATSDFVSLTHKGKRTRLNRALVRYARGHLEETRPVSITAHDSRGGYLALGAIKGEPEARKIARGVMVNREGEAYTTTAELRPKSTATTPYKAFGLGDFITCPDHTDTPVSMQVQAIAFRQENTNATVDWELELADPELTADERTMNWLRRMSDGAVFGGAKVSSPVGTPEPSATDLVALQVAEFSFDNVQLVASLSPRRPAEISANMVEIYGELTTPGTTSTVVEVHMTSSGVTTTLGTLTFVAYDTQVEVPLNVVPVYANRSKLQVEIVTAGTGAEGLDIQVRAI